MAFITKELGRRQRSSIPILIAVHDPRHDGVGIGARTDDEQDNHKEGLEIEERRLKQTQHRQCSNPFLPMTLESDLSGHLFTYHLGGI